MLLALVLAAFAQDSSAPTNAPASEPAASEPAASAEAAASAAPAPASDAPAAEKKPGGVVTLNPPVIRGKLDRDAVSAALTPSLVATRVCYQRALTGAAPFGGQVDVKLAVAPTGTVESATVARSTLRKPEVETCVVAGLATLALPAPTNGKAATVTLPLVFAPPS